MTTEINVTTGESKHQRYGRKVRPLAYQPRFLVGETRYEPPAPNRQQEVAGVKITSGRIYQAIPRSSVCDAWGRSRKGALQMVAAKNNRGELMLCFISDDGKRPVGGYLLSAFVSAELEH